MNAKPPRPNGRSDREELKLILDFYDLMLYLVQRCEKFPRHHRYSLGIAIENRLQTILALLIKAKYTQRQTKRQTLAVVNTELEVLRFQLRLAKDLGALPIKSQGHAADLIEGVGAQVGGWLRSIGDEREARDGPVAARDRVGQPRARPAEGKARQA